MLIKFPVKRVLSGNESDLIRMLELIYDGLEFHISNESDSFLKARIGVSYDEWTTEIESLVHSVKVFNLCFNDMFFRDYASIALAFLDCLYEQIDNEAARPTTAN